MNAEVKNALEVLKKYCSTPKGKDYYEYMKSASLKQRISTIKSNFIHYVDSQTIWYKHTQNQKKDPDYWMGTKHPNYKVVELSKKQREDCISEMEWFKKDIEACINHLKNN